MADAIEAHKVKKFRRWLINNGAEMIPATNEFELLRFSCLHGVGVIYRGKKGIRVSSPFVHQAIEAFRMDLPWDGRGKPVNRVSGSKVKKQLIARDGCECFYCGDEKEDFELTIEHVLCLIHGGNNRMENMVLACKPCNQEAGNKSIFEKIILRDQKRTPRETR